MEAMGLPTCLEYFLGVMTQFGSLGGSKALASCFEPQLALLYPVVLLGQVLNL
jgi:hypothetical protein